MSLRYNVVDSREWGEEYGDRWAVMDKLWAPLGSEVIGFQQSRGNARRMARGLNYRETERRINDLLLGWRAATMRKRLEDDLFLREVQTEAGGRLRWLRS